MSSMITISTTELVPTLRDSLRCQLEAKLGVLLTERQAIDIARNLAQAVMGLEIDDTVVIDTLCAACGRARDTETEEDRLGLRSMWGGL